MRRDHVEILTRTASVPHLAPPMSCSNVIVTEGESICVIDATSGTTWYGSPAGHARNSVATCGKTWWPLILYPECD